jgi:hypothetical protein
MRSLADATAYQKNVMAWMCLMGIEFTFGSLVLYVSTFFIIPFFIVIGCAPFILNRIACPSCNTPVTYQGSIAGMAIQGGFIRKKCQRCGWDLRQNKNGSTIK